MNTKSFDTLCRIHAQLESIIEADKTITYSEKRGIEKALQPIEAILEGLSENSKSNYPQEIRS